MSHFFVCSFSGRRVSILNPVDIDPYDALPLDICFAARHTSASAVPHKRKYKCIVCSRLVSTSGHLTRHYRVHTGERDHVCPFLGCDARCSRRDNLLQHYSLHLTDAERRRGSTFVRRALNKMQGGQGAVTEDAAPWSMSEEHPPRAHMHRRLDS